MNNMCVKDDNPQQPLLLKKFRRWMFVSLIIATLVIIRLLWSYRPNMNFQFYPVSPTTQYHPKTTEPQIPVTTTVPQQCGGVQTVPRGQILSLIKKTKTFLISAYQEHRTGRKEVRVIAVTLRSETVPYRCHICCRGQLHTSDGVRSIHSDHFGFKYGTADIMCPLPSGCETPSHIAVTSPEDELDKEFLEVKNQEAKTDSFAYDFAVCFSVMYEYTNVLQLVQSLEILQLLGVGKVVIYKTSSSPEVQSILDYYTHKGLVEVIPWSMPKFVTVSRRWLPIHGPGDLHYFGQIPALNDCVYRNMYRSRYVALHDLDELIVPQSVKSLVELMPLLEKKNDAKGCYIFENNVFPITVALPPPASQTLPPESRGWQNVSGVNILAHLYQEPVTPETKHSNFKIIVDPRTVFSTTVHGLLESQKGCTWIDRNLGRMYHIRGPRKELKPNQLIYDGRLLSYSAELTQNVNTALTESGLLPKDTVKTGVVDVL